MRKRLVATVGWALLAAVVIVWVERWQPWALIISAIVFVGWVILIADFVRRHRTWRPVLRRERHDSRPGERTRELRKDRQIDV